MNATRPSRPLVGPAARACRGPPADRPILMAATGAGIAPLLAILRGFRLAAHPAPPIRFYYGDRPGGIPHAEELARLAGDLPAFEFLPVELHSDGRLRVRLGPIVRRIGREV